jgi:hypothetical protein
MVGIWNMAHLCSVVAARVAALRLIVAEQLLARDRTDVADLGVGEPKFRCVVQYGMNVERGCWRFVGEYPQAVNELFLQRVG